MAEITAKEVQALRKKTGAGILDCRGALEQTEGDMEAAERILREKGIISAAKRQSRERTQGAVAVVVHGEQAPVGAIAVLECETDFVAKSPDFVSLVEEIANELAINGEEAAGQFSDRIREPRGHLEREHRAGRTVRFQAPEGAIIGSYLHLQNGPASMPCSSSFPVGTRRSPTTLRFTSCSLALNS